MPTTLGDYWRRTLEELSAVLNSGAPREWLVRARHKILSYFVSRYGDEPVAKRPPIDERPKPPPEPPVAPLLAGRPPKDRASIRKGLQAIREKAAVPETELPPYSLVRWRRIEMFLARLAILVATLLFLWYGYIPLLTSTYWHVVSLICSGLFLAGVFAAMVALHLYSRTCVACGERIPPPGEDFCPRCAAEHGVTRPRNQW